jgi:hypothetical protein
MDLADLQHPPNRHLPLCVAMALYARMAIILPHQRSLERVCVPNSVAIAKGTLTDWTPGSKSRKEDRKPWKTLRDFVDDQAIEDALDMIENDRANLDVRVIPLFSRLGVLSTLPLFLEAWC